VTKKIHSFLEKSRNFADLNNEAKSYDVAAITGGRRDVTEGRLGSIKIALKRTIKGTPRRLRCGSVSDGLSDSGDSRCIDVAQAGPAAREGVRSFLRWLMRIVRCASAG
jgi:hypothetical protein